MNVKDILLNSPYRPTLSTHKGRSSRGECWLGPASVYITFDGRAYRFKCPEHVTRNLEILKSFWYNAAFNEEISSLKETGEFDKIMAMRILL